jgi:hypothetical protein
LLGRAQLPYELRDGNADFVGAVLLQEVHPTDRGLGRGTARIAATLTWVPVDNGG